MHGLALLLAAASVGVDYGWQPDADGVMEYIIQIEPELITALQKGEAIISEVHPDATGVRRFRIQIGNGPLPRISKPTSPVVAPPEELSPTKQAVPPAAVPATELPAADASTFKLEESPAAPVKSPASDFPLLPLPEEQPASPDDTPPTNEKRESSFQLPASAPIAAPPVNEEAAQLKKPVPLPDPDRLPLEPARLPMAEKETASQAIPVSETSDTAPQLATFDQQTDAKPVSPTALRDSGTAASGPAPRRWFLFSLTMIALLGSLGANAYLGYLFLGLQNRYQGLRRETQA